LRRLNESLERIEAALTAEKQRAPDGSSSC